MPPATRNVRRRPHRRAHIISRGAAHGIVVRAIVPVVDQRLHHGAAFRLIAGCNARAVT